MLKNNKIICILGIIIIVIIITLIVLLATLDNDKIEGYSNLDKLDFIHIPKTGGGSITEWLNKRGKKWKKSKYIQFKKFSSYDSSNHCVVDLRKIPKDIVTFCVVRNPYNKFISAVNHNISTSYFTTRFKYSINNKIDLNNWVKNNLEKESKVLTDTGGKQISWHFVPQHRYIYNNSKGDKICKHILHQENLQKEFSNFMKDYHPIEDTILSTGLHSFTKKYSINDLNKESLDIINRIYKKDFELLGYKKNN